MDINFKPRSVSRVELEALLMAEFNHGEGIWLDLQDSSYNGGGRVEGAFNVLHSQSRTVIEHTPHESFTAAVRRACQIFFDLEDGHVSFSAVSHYGGELMPLITLEWVHHEDYRHSVTIYPRFAVEQP